MYERINHKFVMEVAGRSDDDAARAAVESAPRLVPKPDRWVCAVRQERTDATGSRCTRPQGRPPFTETFTERFEQAARDGELAAASPNALAHIATAALNTLAVRARTGAEPSELDALIDATLDVICGAPD